MKCQYEKVASRKAEIAAIAEDMKKELGSRHTYPEIIERLDRSVAGKEVERTRTETDDLEVLDADDYACDVAEVGELLDSFVWVSIRRSRS